MTTPAPADTHKPAHGGYPGTVRSGPYAAPRLLPSDVEIHLVKAQTHGLPASHPQGGLSITRGRSS